MNSYLTGKVVQREDGIYYATFENEMLPVKLTLQNSYDASVDSNYEEIEDLLE